MSGLRDMAKGGWHPKGKDGKSKESWRGDFKGINQISGWMGKGKDPSAEANEHVSRPLSTLKDPSSFGPPPKHMNYHGGIAASDRITPETQGLGAPSSKEEVWSGREEEEEAQREAEEAEKPKGPPIPYRADTTGLSTANLPPPPGRTDGADRRSPPPMHAAGGKSKPPSLPPRLPPRQDSTSISASAPKPAKADPHKGFLNQGSINSLSAAGVSVPGFGIGAKSKPTLPPPALSSRTPATTSPVSSSQLNELQSRFSRLSPAPKSESPSVGTSFAEKQAALRTASAFKKDPSSVSFGDAKAAASTANNFRERHGGQVQSGWRSANNINSKYGISDKVGSFGMAPQAEPTPPVSPHVDTESYTKPAGVLGKKKPPPPPAKKAALLGASAPPPIPMSSKPRPSPTPPAQSDFDLDLNSLWFSKSPLKFPPPSMGPDYAMFATSMGWSSSGVRKIHRLTIHARNSKTLGSTKLHITWDSTNPAVTVKAEQKHYPAPRPLSRGDLDSCRARYSNAIASWCETKVGTQVGNGECWTLANEALKAVAAQCSSRGQEPCMPSQSYIHGSVLYFNMSGCVEPVGGTLAAGVARGDIVQFYKAYFEHSNGGKSWAGAPDHTSVVTAVGPDSKLQVLEQNTGGVKIVKSSTYDFSELATGEVRIFRAVGESWIGALDPTW